jgi:hypothetical protein
VRRRSKPEIALADYLERVEGRLMTALPMGVEFEGSPVEVEILSWFSRVRGLFSSVRLLVARGHPDEALILGRSIFETSLRLEQLASVEEAERERLVLGSINKSIDDAIGLFVHEARSLQPGEELSDEGVQELEKRRGQIQRRQQRLGLGELKRFASDKDLAVRFDRKGEYLSFRVAHHTTHGSPLAQHSRTDVTASGVVRVSHRNLDPKWLIGAGTFAAVCALRSMNAVGTIYPFDLSGVAELIDEGETLDDTAGE